MRPLRFCMVTTFYPPHSFGGDGIFVHRLSHALAERGHRVDVVHSVDAYRLGADAEPDRKFETHPNVSVHPLRSRWPGLAALGAHQIGAPAAYGARLRAVLEGEEAPDVIHHHNVSLVGGPGVLRLGRAVKLYTPHEYWLVCPTHVLFKMGREACRERACLRCTLHARRPPQLWRATRWLQACVGHLDRLLVPSRFAAERHRADGIEAPMTVLNHFVPQPAGPDEAGGPPLRPAGEPPYFLFVGRLEKLKGVQDLIRALAGHRGAELRIVGDGAHREALEEQARSLPNVRFLGAVHPDELGRHYRGAVAVVVPSLCYEVCPLIPAEALAHGTPVIARRLGALTEVIEDSGGGLLFSTLDECRDAMRRLQERPQLRDELGRRGREHARRHWSIDAHLDRYLSIVGELVEARRAAT